jgi:type IV secretion system protein VirB2
MILASILQTSLTDPAPESAINAATNWIIDLLFGPLATIIAVIAVGWVGYAMLSGRIDIRRGLLVVLGCFLLFGARGIAEGLRSTAVNEGAAPVEGVPPPPNFTRSGPQANSVNGYDPYAGAAVTQPGQ